MANCFNINPLVHRAGQIKGFTGIDQPYERPDNPEVVVDTVKMSLFGFVLTIILLQVGHSVPECVEHIVSAMKQRSLMPDCNQPLDERSGELMVRNASLLTCPSHSLR